MCVHKCIVYMVLLMSNISHLSPFVSPLLLLLWFVTLRRLPFVLRTLCYNCRRPWLSLWPSWEELYLSVGLGTRLEFAVTLWGLWDNKSLGCKIHWSVASFQGRLSWCFEGETDTFPFCYLLFVSWTLRMWPREFLAVGWYVSWLPSLKSKLA